MQKPLSLVVRDLKQDIAAAINKSGLHSSVTLLILEEYVTAFRNTVNRQEQEDEAAYVEALKKEKEKEGPKK